MRGDQLQEQGTSTSSLENPALVGEGGILAFQTAEKGDFLITKSNHVLFQNIECVLSLTLLTPHRLAGPAVSTW